MENNYKEKLHNWLENMDRDSLYDEITQLIALGKEGEAELEERFYKDLKFGTGGLRGVLGAGTNRLNVYTVSRASQGLANYILQEDINKSVAIAYDTRINSRLFAETAAGVFVANGIKVYMYKEVGTVPQLSFATRNFECGMGVMVTASHNPSKYNGYKVYCKYGYQITDQQAAEILACIDKLDMFEGRKKAIFEETEKNPLFTYLDEDVVDVFVATSTRKYEITESRATEGDESTAKDLKIVYSPLNGAGNVPVRKMLKRLGFEDVTIVKEQELPDGNFPTCSYPNPENPKALDLGIKLSEEISADLLLATDPDCDRVGTAVKTADGYKLLSGNQMGLLMFRYIAEQRKLKGQMPKNPVVIRSMVTSKLTDKIAEAYGIETKVTLTGFKYMGELITELENKGEADNYIFAYEESYGYLADTHARDKDGINASMIICQMADYYKSKGMTLVDALDDLYNTYGYEECGLLNFEFEGIQGEKTMERIMALFRENTLTEIDGNKQLSYVDYNFHDTGLPRSNALEFVYDNGLAFTVRPSGTEPKLKIYTFTCGISAKDAIDKNEKLSEILRSIIKNG